MKSTSHDRFRLALTGIVVILAPLVINGCAEAPTSHPVTAQQYLIGKSESEILACAGTPQTVSSQDGLRVLSYSKEAGLLEESFPGSKGSFPEGVRHSCTVIVTLQNDQVIQVQYRITPQSTATHEHCEEVFQHCRQ